jgi:DNA-binding NarL/FixJ family response regulator
MQANATLDRPSRRDAVLMRRTKARVVVLNAHGGVAYAEPAAIELLSRMLDVPEESLERLPAHLELAIAEAARTLRSGADATIEPVPNLLIRVMRLIGRSGDSVTALHVEQRTERQALSSASRSYKLTRRETDVLALIMQGKPTPEIARELYISDTTVLDYIKRLLQKTVSRSRTEMLAKIMH